MFYLFFFTDYYFSRIGGHVHHNNTHGNLSKSGIQNVRELVVTDLPQIYSTRKRLVQQECFHTPEYRDFRHSEILVIPRENILICSTSKTIKSLWENSVLVDAARTPSSTGTPHENLNGNDNEFNLLKHYEPDQIRMMLDNYYKVLFVSSPVFHKYEAYSLEVSNNDQSQRTFPSYVDSIIHGDLRVPNFTELCLPCHVKYDLIAQIETLKKDVKYLYKTRWPNVKEEISVTEVELLLQRSREPLNRLNSTLADQLKSMYRLDYEMFGYQ